MPPQRTLRLLFWFVLKTVQEGIHSVLPAGDKRKNSKHIAERLEDVKINE